MNMITKLSKLLEVNDTKGLLTARSALQHWHIQTHSHRTLMAAMQAADLQYGDEYLAQGHVDV